MKKTHNLARSLVLIITAIIALSSCSSSKCPPSCSCGDTPQTASQVSETVAIAETAEKSTEHHHNWISATCTEPKTCSECGETTGTALGHSTTTGICTRCGYNSGKWELGYYVDEFRNPTDFAFVKTYSYGRFSNSATTDSDLTAIVQVDTEDVMIVLIEYSQNYVKCSYEYDEYDIVMLDPNGKKHYLKGTMYEGSFRIYVDDEYKSTVLDALKTPGTVSFYIVRSELLTSTYSFSIETSNFSTLYEELG